MSRRSIISDQIREGLFHLSELPDPKPQEEAGDGEAQRKARPIELALPAKKAPTEAVDNSDHRVERVDQPPLVWNYAGAETNRRYIEPELHDKRNDIAEIPVFDV